VTTKTGLCSAGGEEQSALSVFLPKAGGKLLPALSTPTIDLSVARAQHTLEGSLRRRGRDCIGMGQYRAVAEAAA
jgi:hypothetical protein